MDVAGGVLLGAGVAFAILAFLLSFRLNDRKLVWMLVAMALALISCIAGLVFSNG